MEKKKCRSIKAESKALLEGKLAKCASSLALLAVIILTISLFGELLRMLIQTYGFIVKEYIAYIIISIIVLLLNLTVFFTYTLGELKRYFKTASGENPSAVSSMCYISAKGIWLVFKALFSILIRIIAIAIISAIPLAIAYAGLYILEYYEFSIPEWIKYIEYFYLVIDFLVVLTLAQRYFLVPYLVTSNNDITVTEACKKSSKAMQGEKFSVVILKLTFIPWAILSILIIPLLYSVPYYNTAIAVKAYDICQRKTEF